MKLGIIGLPGSGKTTLFEALTRSEAKPTGKIKSAVAMVRVPDPRVAWLSGLYQPRKTTYAQVEYLLPEPEVEGREEERVEALWNLVRACDSLVHVVRNFNGNGHGGPAPVEDFKKLEREMIFSDFLVVEKRLERMQAELKRGKKISEAEQAVLQACGEVLQKDVPLREAPELASSPLLRGYCLLSAKPELVLLNNEDEDGAVPSLGQSNGNGHCLAVKGKIEHELSRMSPEEAGEFMAEFGISESARDRVIERSYQLVGLISFFTVGEDEVKAWTIRRGTAAVDAADVIHSDIKKGFIRAEVLAYEDLVAAGNFAEARKRGTVRLEGKTYEVQDGDIINFRFNV
jgi:ribosome-binding ATPase